MMKRRQRRPTPKTQKKQQSEQSPRFIDKAREFGVDESVDPLDRILKRIVKPQRKDEKKETPDK